MWLSGLTLSISGGAKCRPLIEAKRHGLVTVNFPDPFCGIPFASNTFDTALQFGFGVALTCRKRFTLSPTKLLVPSRVLQELRCAATGLGSRSDPSEPVSNGIRTSTSHCATSGRRARVLGSRWEAVHAATGTPGDQPPHAHLQEPPRIRL
jgi:hypothetical protein